MDRAGSPHDQTISSLSKCSRPCFGGACWGCCSTHTPPAACSSSAITSILPTRGLYLGPLWTTDWFVYAKRPFAGPEQVLAYLSRYTHRVAISNSRLVSADASGVTFTYKAYRIEGPERSKTMTLEPGEFIRRFLMHVLPKGFHRIRHYGLLANGTGTRAEKLARARELIAAAAQVSAPQQPPHDGTCQDTTLSEQLDHPCPHCGSRMQIIETFEPGHRPRHRPSAPVVVIGMNTS